ncbi:MAG: AmmeMemoRadiSam system protein A [bacterium]
MTREPLSAAAREALRAIARASVYAAVRGLPRPNDAPRFPELARPHGAFVTLKLRGRLRGCMGRVVTAAPLWESVADVARDAALDDPRFQPLTAADASDVEIEISVLGPLRAVRGVAEIHAGDGLLVRKSGRSGLLLPQVAKETGWGAERFLEETCVKAGLPRDAWTKDAEILAFTAEVF